MEYEQIELMAKRRMFVYSLLLSDFHTKVLQFKHVVKPQNQYCHFVFRNWTSPRSICLPACHHRKTCHVGNVVNHLSLVFWRMAFFRVMRGMNIITIFPQHDWFSSHRPSPCISAQCRNGGRLGVVGRWCWLQIFSSIFTTSLALLGCHCRWHVIYASISTRSSTLAVESDRKCLILCKRNHESKVNLANLKCGHSLSWALISLWLIEEEENGSQEAGLPHRRVSIFVAVQMRRDAIRILLSQSPWGFNIVLPVL